MGYKVFMKILFEKPKYFLFYALLMTTFWYVLFIGVADSMFAVHFEKMIPDIEISEITTDVEQEPMAVQGRGSLPFHKLKDESTKIFSFTVSEFYIDSKAESPISCQVYEAEEAFFQELEGYLNRGKLPEAGKREAVIGSELAKSLNVYVGSVLKLPVGLELGDMSEHEYMVSGILDKDMSFYSNGIYISKETPILSYPESGNHVWYIYTKDDNAYYKLRKQLGHSGREALLGIWFHREVKVSLGDTIVKSLIKTIPFSAVFLTALFLSLMKYTSKKIGLMKALGFKEWDIIRILIKGFGIVNLCGILNSFIAMGFIRLASLSPFPPSVFLYTVCSHAIIFIVTLTILSTMCKAIQPKQAMFQY